MSKPKGATSFETLTLEELRDRLGGRSDIPVKVSKGWLAAVDELLGNKAVDTSEPVPTPEADADNSGSKAGGVRVELD